jgi:hypothetical protein
VEKLYCYVDETGQHTDGAIFVVSVATAKHDRDELELLLERIELETGKKATKWMKTRRDIREAYLSRIFREPSFKGRLFYTMSKGTRDYKPLTLIAIASAVTAVRHSQDYKASIFIDGLKRSEYRAVSTGLHRIGVVTGKVRGVADESSVFIRLADAMAGIVREAEEGLPYAQALCKRGKSSGVLRSA